MKHDRLAGTPVLVVNLGAVLGGDRTHVCVSACMEGFAGSRFDRRAEKCGEGRIATVAPGEEMSRCPAGINPSKTSHTPKAIGCDACAGSRIERNHALDPGFGHLRVRTNPLRVAQQL